MQHEFPASGPQHLYVELQSGDLDVIAVRTDRVTVDVVGDEDDTVLVEQEGDRVSVVGQRRTGFLLLQRRGVTVTVTAPEDSSLVTKLGSATVRTQGRLGEVRVSTGSGDVMLEEAAASAVVKTGSGAIRARVFGAAAHLQTGSGSITVEELHGDAQLTTGSGDIEVTWAARPVSLKSGSGDLTLHATAADAVLSAASGDLHVGEARRGQLHLKNVSGDIRLGIPEGIPVWTDISTGTGEVYSHLRPTGAPAEGQEYVEVRAKTVTGDITLEQLTRETS
jgi:DUF4097 and DUF4098 domain-containing protein YvlB